MTAGPVVTVTASRRTQRLAVSLVAVIAVVLVATRGRLWDRSAHTILADLAVVGGSRAVQPRLSLPLPYAPFRMATPSERRPTSLRLMSSVVRVALPAEEGLTYLLLGEWETALASLERANPKASPVDLAAAYYMRGVATDSLLDFCRALDALRDAGDAPEVLFNRALIFEQLSDYEAAAATWEQYLAKDAKSPWAMEARRHLERDRGPSVAATWLRDKPLLLEAAAKGNAELVRALVGRYPLAARRLVELELLPSWGEAHGRGDTLAAARALNAARRIVAERHVREEQLLFDAIREIDSAMAARTADGLARAYATYRTANDALNVSNHGGALVAYLEALSHAGAGASAVHAIITPALITAHYRRYESAEADVLIALLRKRFGGQRERYLTLFARLDWLEGLLHIARPDAIQAITSYGRALAIYDRLGEAEYQAAQHINHADSYIYLGDYDRAAAHVRKALRFAWRAEDPGRLQGILKVASRLSLETASPAAAVVFQDRLVRVMRAASDPMRLPDALVARSAVLSRAGRREEALRDLDEVRRLAPRIADLPTRQRMEADANAAEAFAYRDRDHRRVLESLSRAIELFELLETRAFLVQLLLERGRTHLRLGDVAAAERDFRDGIDVLETQRDMVGEASLRIAYFDRADRIFVDLAALLLRRGRVDEAFDLLERLRARELLDRASGKAMRPLPVAEIRRRLPAGAVSVTYALHAEGLMTFVVTRDSIRAFDTAIAEPELRQLSLQTSHDALRRLGEILFGRVAAPPGSRIIFVPDETLSRVPFAALRMPDGRHLIESHTLSVAPSATLVVRERAQTPPRPKSILIVASREQPVGFANLPPLPRTTAEAKRVAQRYASSETMSASNMDAAAVLSAAGRHDIFHFAGHGVVDHRAPARSALLIGTSGRITAAHVEKARLSNLELVILGGCNTGVGKSHRSEGTMSLARAFMAAGVASVLSTVAPIDDPLAERVLSEFHRGYASGLDAPSALREAQLQMLRSGDARDAEPGGWSAFQVFGGELSRR